MCEINKDRKNQSENEQPDLDVLQAGLFLLMTQYYFRQCPGIADKIVEHLIMLCNHPQIELLPSQNRLYAKMINVWRARQFGHADRSGGGLH